MPPKPYSPQSADSLMHPDARLEPSEQDEADRKIVSAKEVRERYSNLEARIDLAKGEAAEARDATIALAKVVEERFAMLFGDMATLMGSNIRIERSLENSERKLEQIEPRLDATVIRVGRLDNENEENRESIRKSRDSINVVSNDVKSTQRRQAELATQNKMDRKLMEDRHKALKTGIADALEAAIRSGQQAAVGEAFGRKALDSVDELGEITKIKVQETVEINREGREDKRHLWKWALGAVIGPLIIAAVTYELTHPTAAHAPQTPAGAHS